MRCDSIEFGWAQQTARNRRKADAGGFASARAPMTQVAGAEVMDEAFARFDDAADGRKSPPVDQTLVATLAAQLEALDRQREHLANLLRSVEVSEQISSGAAL